jgi:hypothetical protein
LYNYSNFQVFLLIKRLANIPLKLKFVIRVVVVVVVVVAAAATPKSGKHRYFYHYLQHEQIKQKKPKY